MLLATVVVNARMISLRCFSLIRTLYSIDIIFPLMRFNMREATKGPFSPNVERNTFY